MSVYTVYGLRVRGTADVRYIGQTNNLLELRLIGHHRTARRMPRPTRFADWLKSHGGDVEIFSIHICTTRAEAVAKEQLVIHTCVAVGWPIFNQHHVPPHLRLPQREPEAERQAA